MNKIPDDELRTHIRNFLDEFKALILEKGLSISERVKNREALIELGLTARQREEEILSLSIDNYHDGPLADEYKPGNYWVFGKKINGVEVYIKLKIAKVSGEEFPICFSFHKSESPLSYRFAQKT